MERSSDVRPVLNSPVERRRAPEPPAGLVCADDDALVADAVRLTAASLKEVRWLGAVRNTADLEAIIERLHPLIVLLDHEIPSEPLSVVLPRLKARHPDVRVVIYSGHVDSELIEAALSLGAWGYISKGEPLSVVAELLRRVARGDLVLSPEAERMWGFVGRGSGREPIGPPATTDRR